MLQLQQKKLLSVFMHIDLDSESFLDSIEELASQFIIVLVFYRVFLIVSWPFITVARLLVFIISFGKVKPSYRASFSHPIISFIALILFMSVLLWFLVIVVPKFYV